LVNMHRSTSGKIAMADGRCTIRNENNATSQSRYKRG
jgi:hypothetical protein